MLAALLSGKLDRELKRDPTEIEDLLTSIVFGACQYVQVGEALIPFLSRARDVQGTKLAELLADVSSATYEFWPWWSDAPGPEADQPAERQSSSDADKEQESARGHEPDVGEPCS